MIKDILLSAICAARAADGSLRSAGFQPAKQVLSTLRFQNCNKKQINIRLWAKPSWVYPPHSPPVEGWCEAPGWLFPSRGGVVRSTGVVSLLQCGAVLRQRHYTS